jgi:hypothetical protein
MAGSSVDLHSGEVFCVRVAYNGTMPGQFFCWWFPESPYSLGLIMRRSLRSNDE